MGNGAQAQGARSGAGTPWSCSSPHPMYLGTGHQVGATRLPSKPGLSRGYRRPTQPEALATNCLARSIWTMSWHPQRETWGSLRTSQQRAQRQPQRAKPGNPAAEQGARSPRCAAPALGWSRHRHRHWHWQSTLPGSSPRCHPPCAGRAAHGWRLKPPMGFPLCWG